MNLRKNQQEFLLTIKIPVDRKIKACRHALLKLLKQKTCSKIF